MTRRKIILDIALCLLLLMGLAGMVVPRSLHEIGGYALVALIVYHIWLNRNFFKNLSHGPYRPARIVNAASIFLFAAALLVLLVSGTGMTDLFAAHAAWNLRSLHLYAAITTFVMLLIHLSLHARRYIRGKVAGIVILLVLLLSAAGIAGLPYLDRWYRHVSVHLADIVPGEKAVLPGRTLTVYFTRVGNTDFPPGVDAVSGASLMTDGAELHGNAETLARMAQDAAGGDLLALRTVKTYPAIYSKTTAEAQREFAQQELPALKESDINPEDYDNIILVYPIWWNKTPMPVISFVTQYNLAGKRILPIVTHGGSRLGDAVETLRERTNADVAAGLDIYSSDVPSARTEIADYLNHSKEGNE